MFRSLDNSSCTTKALYKVLSPGNTGLLCINSVKEAELTCVLSHFKCVLVDLSYSTLCDPTNCSLPGSSIHGIFQARVLERVAIPSPGNHPDPGIEPESPALQVDSLLPSYRGSPRTNTAPFKWTFVTCVELPRMNMSGARGGEMVAPVTLFAVSLEVERALSRE